MPWWGWVIYGVIVALGLLCAIGVWFLDPNETGRDHE